MEKTMTTIKVTPDAKLVTPEAIQFRIDQIKKENGGVLTPAVFKRVAALNLRLKAPLSAPINPALLLSKGEEEWGDRRKCC
jgi:hypothetical protein